MAIITNGDYEVFNGTDMDIIHFSTKASQVSIADTGGKITATNVEDALPEIANKISVLNGAGAVVEKADKTELTALDSKVTTHLANNVTQIGNINDATLDVSLKGKSLTDMAKVLFQNANEGKTLEANAITAKGVPASPTETFASLAAKIGQIATGKKVASGSVTSLTSVIASFTSFDGNGSTTSSSQAFKYITVSGLTFKPSIIIFYLTDITTEAGIYCNDTGSKNYVLCYETYYRNMYKINIANDSNTYVNNTGFTIPTLPFKAATFQWIAIE